MATTSVPGADPKNNDKLKVGCWGEHLDGSLIYVKGLDEGGIVVFEVYDFGDRGHPVYYTHELPLKDFQKTFTYSRSDRPRKREAADLMWTWHDKTPMPWNRVRQHGQRSLTTLISDDGNDSAAKRIAESLDIRMRSALTPQVINEREGLVERPAGKTAKTIAQRLKNALAELVG